jgi:hypothetical protein
MRVLVAAAAFVVAGSVAGCDQTVPGTVAMTTEPGGSTSSTRTTGPRTTSPRTSGPRTTTPRTSSNNPPPSNVADITCKEYVTLDPDTQTSVVEEILTDEASVLGPGDAEMAKTLVDAVCTFLPASRVSEILTGGGPP